jgi:hypothetical protein
VTRRRNTFRVIGLFLGCVLTASAWGEILFDVSQRPGPAPVTAVYAFPVAVTALPASFGLKVETKLTEGEGSVRLVASDGQVVHSVPLKHKGACRYALAGPVYAEGDYRFEVNLRNAVGQWRVVAMRLGDRKKLEALLAPGPLMILVGLAFLLGWKLHSRTGWEWFLAGALVWLAAAAPKELWRWGLNEHILAALERHTSPVGRVTVGCAYHGLLAGAFEIGVLVVAARVWKSLSATANRAVSVAITAGALKAVVLGVSVLTTTALAFSGDDAETLVETGYAMFRTPLFWLLGPTRQVISTLCQMGARTAVLYGVVSGKRRFVAIGFVVVAAHVATASLPALSDTMGRLPLWWSELAAFPWALACFYLTGWCIRRWPASDRPV